MGFATASGVGVAIGRVFVRLGSCRDCLNSVRSSWIDWRMGFPLFFAFIRGKLSQFLFSSLSFWLLCLLLFSYIFPGVASDPVVPLSGSFWFPDLNSVSGLFPGSSVGVIGWVWGSVCPDVGRGFEDWSGVRFWLKGLS